MRLGVLFLLLLLELFLLISALVNAPLITLGWCLLTGVIGVLLVKNIGLKLQLLGNLMASEQHGKLFRQLPSGILTLLAGISFIIPGFISDALAAILLLIARSLPSNDEPLQSSEQPEPSGQSAQSESEIVDAQWWEDKDSSEPTQNKPDR